MQDINSIYINSRRDRKKVLLVEDDPSWQLIIGNIFRIFDLKYEVHCVRTVKQAQNMLFKSSNYEMIIADHYLDGEVTGQSLWRTCNEKYRRIPFIMVSGLSKREYCNLFENEDDIPDYFNKSQSIDALINLLDLKLNNDHAPRLSTLKRNFLILTMFMTIVAAHTFLNQNEPKMPIVSSVETSNSKEVNPKSTFDVNTVVTPELRIAINRIVAKADIINNRIKQNVEVK